jgi:thiamine biosynthesis lipoprotein
LETCAAANPRIRVKPPSLALWLLAALLLSGCQSPQVQTLHRFKFTHPAMGTLFTIELYGGDRTEAGKAAEAAFRRVDELEDIMSDYRADSELMRLCDQPFGKPVPVSADLFAVVEQAQKASALSGGAFDITVGPYVRLWRFARKRKVLPTPAELAAAAPAVGFRKLRLDGSARTITLVVPNMRLDLGGIAKGYAADQALLMLKGRGFNRALVAASGDIAIGDPPPGQPGWKVGIARIDARADETASTVLLHNCGISTSGDTEQHIEIGGVRYSHVIDPATGLGLTNRLQASVIAPSATLTDRLDNTLCILGIKRGLALADRLPRTAAMILNKRDGETQVFFSRRFKPYVARNAPAGAGARPTEPRP